MNNENTQCRWHNQMLAYYDGELEAGAFESVKIHLTSCSACQQELLQLQAIHQLLNQVPQPELSTRSRNQLQLRWRQQQNDRGALRMAYSLLAVAASLLLCAGLWLPWVNTHTAVAGPVTTIETNSSDSDISVGSRDDLVLTAWVGQDFSRSATHE